MVQAAMSVPLPNLKGRSKTGKVLALCYFRRRGILPSRFSTACAGLILASLLFLPQSALAQFAQQGPKLVGTGVVGQAIQRFSVSVCAMEALPSSAGLTTTRTQGRRGFQPTVSGHSSPQRG